MQWYEELPSELEIATSPKQCAKCREIKPRRLFDRPLTRAQAAYRGFANKHVVYVESKFCGACQPGGYRPSKMTEAQILEAAANGRASPQRAAIDIEAKRRRANKLKSEAQIKRWVDARARPWLELRDRISDELRHVRYLRKNYTFNYHPLEQTAPFIRFIDAYNEVLRRAKAACTLHARTNTSSPQRSVRMPDHLDRLTPDLDRETFHELNTMSNAIDEHVALALDAWDAVPAAMRTRLRRFPRLVTKADQCQHG